MKKSFPHKGSAFTAVRQNTATRPAHCKDNGSAGRFFCIAAGEKATLFSIFCTRNRLGKRNGIFSFLHRAAGWGKRNSIFSFWHYGTGGGKPQGKASREDWLFSSRHRQENGKWRRILLNEIDYRREKNGTFNSR